jgi:hypothetical protein
MTGPIPARYRRWLEIAFTIVALAGVIALITGLVDAPLSLAE